MFYKTANEISINFMSPQKGYVAWMEALVEKFCSQIYVS